MLTAQAVAPRGRPLERFLRLFTDVRDGEGPQLLLLAFNTFLILASYYLMKPVREVLILDHPLCAAPPVHLVFRVAGQMAPRYLGAPGKVKWDEDDAVAWRL